LGAEKGFTMTLISSVKNSVWAFLLTCFLIAPISVLADTHGRKIMPIVTEDYPPYEMKIPIQGLQGFDYELATLIFKQLRYEPQITFYPWKRALQETRLGNTVGILTCAYRQERESFIIYSDPISEFTNGFYTRKNHRGIKPKTLEDVVDLKVASIVEYESLKALQELGMTPIAAPNTKTAVRMLHKNRFDYLYVAKQATDFEIRLAGLSGEFDFHPILTNKFYFCFSKKFPNIRQIVEDFNSALKQLQADGTIGQIRSNYQ